MLAEDLIWPKMQERSPCNRVGWEKSIFLINFTFSKTYNYTLLLGWGLHRCERGKVPSPWAWGGFISSEISWDRKRASRLRGNAAAGLWQAGQRERAAQKVLTVSLESPAQGRVSAGGFHCGAGCLIQLTRQWETKTLASVLGYWH